MSVERLASLEGRVERLSLSLDALARQVSALAQQLWQLAGRGGGAGGGGPVRVRLDDGIGAGSAGSPASAIAYLLNFDGTDGAEIDLKSEFGTALAGSHYAWAQLVASDYYLVQADC